MSDAVWLAILGSPVLLAIVATIVPTLTAVLALIVGLRASANARQIEKATRRRDRRRTDAPARAEEEMCDRDLPDLL